jgi:hypothetical protein
MGLRVLDWRGKGLCFRRVTVKREVREMEQVETSLLKGGRDRLRGLICEARCLKFSLGEQGEVCLL